MMATLVDAGYVYSAFAVFDRFEEYDDKKAVSVSLFFNAIGNLVSTVLSIIF